MKEFQVHVGVAAPLMMSNIDTDAIIPSREVKNVSKSGLSDGLFSDWRYLHEGKIRMGPNPNFVLNQTGYEDTSIILAGVNFGCGSSREYAVWALAEYGIRSILAPSFGSIFFDNCVRNGILPVVLNQSIVEHLARLVEIDPVKHKIRVDLDNMQIMAPDQSKYDFDIAPLCREMLLNGLDPIDMTLKYDSKIKEFKIVDRLKRPWAYLDSDSC